MDKTCVLDTIFSKGVHIEHAMAGLVQRALEIDGWDRFVVLEADVCAPLGAFNRIARYEPEHAVVGSLYFSHILPHDPYVFLADDKPGWWRPISPRSVLESVQDPGLYECDAVGMGFTSIARHVLQDWPADVPMWFCRPPIKGHDFWFCQQVRDAGHTIFFDSAILCDHLTEVPVGLGHNQHKQNGIPRPADLDTPLRTLRFNPDPVEGAPTHV